MTVGLVGGLGGWSVGGILCGGRLRGEWRGSGGSGGMAYLVVFGWDEEVGVSGVAEGGCYVEGRGDVVGAVEVVVPVDQLSSGGVFAGGYHWFLSGGVNSIWVTVGDLQEKIGIFHAIGVASRLCGGGVFQRGVGCFGSGAVIDDATRSVVWHCGT